MLFLCGLTFVTKSIFFILWEVFYIKQELPINGQIRAKEVNLIGENGEKLGVVAFKEAIAKCRGDVWLTSPYGDKY